MVSVCLTSCSIPSGAQPLHKRMEVPQVQQRCTQFKLCDTDSQMVVIRVHKATPIKFCFWSPPASIFVVWKLLLLLCIHTFQQEAGGQLPVAHVHLLARHTRAVNMAILKDSKQIMGVWTSRVQDWLSL